MCLWGLTSQGEKGHKNSDMLACLELRNLVTIILTQDQRCWNIWLSSMWPITPRRVRKGHECAGTQHRLCWSLGASVLQSRRRALHKQETNYNSHSSIVYCYLGSVPSPLFGSVSWSLKENILSTSKDGWEDKIRKDCCKGSATIKRL